MKREFPYNDTSQHFVLALSSTESLKWHQHTAKGMSQVTEKPPADLLDSNPKNLCLIRLITPVTSNTC